MRRLFKVLVGTVLIVVLLGLGLVFFLDSLAKSAVERGASSSLGVKTTVKDMDLGVMAGECTIESLEVANPEGFQAPSFLAMKSGSMKLTLGSLLSEKVVMPRLTLSGIDMVLEQKGTLTNASVIVNNLRRGSGEEPARKAPPKEGKKYVIEELEIQDVGVKVQLSALGSQVADHALKVPSIRLQNVGSDSGGVGMRELCAVVLQALLDEVVKRGGSNIPGGIMGSLTQDLGKLKGAVKIDKIDPGVLESPGKILEGAKGILSPPKEKPKETPKEKPKE